MPFQPKNCREGKHSQLLRAGNNHTKMHNAFRDGVDRLAQLTVVRPAATLGPAEPRPKAQTS